MVGLQQVYGCGHNGFQQFDGLRKSQESENTSCKELSENNLKQKQKLPFQMKEASPLFLFELSNSNVEDVKITWSRIAISLKNETSCFTTVVSGYLLTETNSRGHLLLDDCTCIASSNIDILFSDVKSCKDLSVLKEGHVVKQPLRLKQAQSCDLGCIGGGHHKFYCVYDRISLGHFSSTSQKQESNDDKEEREGKETHFEKEKIFHLHHLDCVVPIKEVSCGKEHVLLLASSGSVYSFGLNSRSQLGHGDVEEEKTPRLIESLEGLPIKSIAAGGWHSLAVSEIGDVYIWGWNESGQLGMSESTRFQGTPNVLDLADDVNAKAVACGSRHTIVLTETGQVFSCGWNKYGQLGLGHTDPVNQLTPVASIPGQCIQVFASEWNSIFVCQK